MERKQTELWRQPVSSLRYAISLQTNALWVRRSQISVILKRISVTCAILACREPLALGDQVVLKLPRLDQVPSNVIWVAKGRFEVKFEMPLSHEKFESFLDLLSPDPLRT